MENALHARAQILVGVRRGRISFFDCWDGSSRITRDDNLTPSAKGPADHHHRECANLPPPPALRFGLEDVRIVQNEKAPRSRGWPTVQRIAKERAMSLRGAQQ